MMKFDRSSGATRLRVFLIAAVLIFGAGYFLAKHFDRREEGDVASTEFNELVVALRENRNRLEVYRLSGTVTTKASVFGGPGDVLRGEVTVKQPWSASYFADMSKLSLEDYIWDAPTRTLLVRSPPIRADSPNIDESKRIVSYKGPLITRDMQTRLQQAIARGAQKQASDEANKPENIAAAIRAARAAVVQNIEGPLKAAGLGSVTIIVRTPVDGIRDSERWDVSRSIAEVLAERAAR